MRWKWIKWDKRSASIQFTHFHYSNQTLTALDLSSNNIGVREAQLLAAALKVNRVKFKTGSGAISSSSSMCLDTHQTRYTRERLGRRRNEAFMWCTQCQSSAINDLLRHDTIVVFHMSRRLPLWICVGTTSVLEEQNMWATLWYWIRCDQRSASIRGDSLCHCI